MFSKSYPLFVLVLFPVLTSCSSTGAKPDEAGRNKVNLSEQVILASLGNQLKSGVIPENHKSSIAPSCVFDGGEDFKDRKKFDATIKDKLMSGANNYAPLTDGQIHEAFKLLKTGQAGTDIQETIFTVLNGIPDLPHEAVSDIPNLFRNPTNLTNKPGIDVAGKTVKVLIRPDKPGMPGNTTFRLAILAYARMNGVNIEERNLDDLYNYLETGHEADFDRLVVGGLNAMKENYGLADIAQASQKLHSIGEACRATQASLRPSSK